MNSTNEKLLRAHVRLIPDFPKPGIMFLDFCPLMEDPQLRSVLKQQLIDQMDSELSGANVCAGLDSRGLWLAALVAKSDQRFVPIRKAGKLPPPVVRAEYSLEYGSAVFELSTTAIKPGDKVVLVSWLPVGVFSRVRSWFGNSAARWSGRSSLSSWPISGLVPN